MVALITFVLNASLIAVGFWWGRRTLRAGDHDKLLSLLTGVNAWIDLPGGDRITVDPAFRVCTDDHSITQLFLVPGTSDPAAIPPGGVLHCEIGERKLVAPHPGNDDG